MTMWVSLDAINAEVEYRREKELRRAAVARFSRRRLAERSERRRAERNGGSGGRTPDATDGDTSRHRDATLPAQRTPGSSPVPKQPV